MKVTVCFGATRVVVPCGDGNIFVKDLIREAILRYKKATAQGSNSVVIVHHLQSLSGGGILDPDDRLNDVVDDREQIVVNYEDIVNDGVVEQQQQQQQQHHHGGGDGASGSSAGTCSPDIFLNSKKAQLQHQQKQVVDIEYKMNGGDINENDDNEDDEDDERDGHDDDDDSGGDDDDDSRGGGGGGHKHNDDDDTESNIDGAFNNIEVTVDDIHSAACNHSQLQVRRGSEPVLNTETIQNQKMVQDEKLTDINEQMLKRWSAAAPVLHESHASNSLPSVHQKHLKYHLDANGNRNGTGTALQAGVSTSSSTAAAAAAAAAAVAIAAATAAPLTMPHHMTSAFSRDNSHRLSMQFSSGHFIDNYYPSQWLVEHNMNGEVLRERKEPLGQAKCSDNINNNTNSQIETIAIAKVFGSKLGLHISPFLDNSNNNYDYCTNDGLLVEAIEPNGLIDRDGRLAVHDRVLEINGHNVAHVPYQQIHELFETCDQHPDHIVLKVLKHRPKMPPPPVFPKPLTVTASSSTANSNNNNKNSSTNVTATVITSNKLSNDNSDAKNFISNLNKIEEKENVDMIEVEEKLSKPSSKLAMVSPTKKLPQSQSNNSSIRSAKSASYALAFSNTRKLGKIIELELVKGIHGLGFSITTRDNPAGGNCPIYIKNILPKGSAVEDGRLKSGDRLLEANGIEMTGKSQNEAVAILRNAPFGSVVKIVVSRQIDDCLPDHDNKEREIEPIVTRHENPNSSTDTTSPDSSAANSSGSGVNNSHPETFWANHQTATVSSVTKNRSNVVNGSGNKSIESTKSGQDNPVSSSNNRSQTNDADRSVPVEKSAINPWESRRVLTLDIPITENEQGGLGISVRGKNFSDSKGKTFDLGIFVKNVLQGGAAYRDKRLQVNDQLLMVNGVSLLSQPNSEAMETLRRALVSNLSPNQNYVAITVARSNNSNDTSSNTNGSYGSSGTGSGATFKKPQSLTGTAYTSGDDFGGHTRNHSKTQVTESFQHPALPSNRNCHTSADTWNPVVNKLMLSDKSSAQLRNESYLIATKNAWNISNRQPFDLKTASTINSSNSAENIIIEDETVDGANQRSHQNLALKELSKATLMSKESCERLSAYESQSSLETTVMPSQRFSRDAFGRQSVSEKRHATIDAKTMSTYQRNKKLREERSASSIAGNKAAASAKSAGVRAAADSCAPRAGSMESIADYKIRDNDLADGVKKSSSLESIHNMIQKVHMSDNGPSSRNPDSNIETNAKKHWLLDSPKRPDDDQHLTDVFKVRDTDIKQNSHNSSFQKKEKKKSNILKNFGSIFRLNNSRPSSTSKPIVVTTVNTATSTKAADFVNQNQEKRSTSFEQQQQQQYTAAAATAAASAAASYQQHSPQQHQQSQYHLQKDSNNNKLKSRTYSPNAQYVNYAEIQNQFMARKEQLTENQIAQMRLQVQKQRLKAEEENRKYYYQSQRQSKNSPHMRPVSNFYEYESITGTTSPPSHMRLQHNPAMQKQRSQDSSSYGAISVSQARRFFESQQQQQQQQMMQVQLQPQQQLLQSAPQSHHQQIVNQNHFVPLQQQQQQLQHQNHHHQHHQQQPQQQTLSVSSGASNRKPYITQVQIGGDNNQFSSKV